MWGGWVCGGWVYAVLGVGAAGPWPRAWAWAWAWAWSRAWADAEAEGGAGGMSIGGAASRALVRVRR